MKFSFVATVLNEKDTILDLLQALENQSQKPDEVIIVDGGSTDQTPKLIRDFHAKSSLDIKLLVKKTSRSRGRNLGIGQAIGEGIAVSDAGCIPHKHWFKHITKALRDKKADVVAGIYRMKTNSIFTRCSAPFFGPMSHNINKHNFLPASRSIAFTKAAWEKIGGYPPRLKTTAEDLVFAQKLKSDPDLKWVLRKSAWVEWTPPQNFKEFYRAIRNYTFGNVEAAYAPHLKKNALVLTRYLIGFSLVLSSLVSANPIIIGFTLLTIVGYLIYPSIKFKATIHHPLEPFYLSLLQLTADFAVLGVLFSYLFPSRSKQSHVSD